MNSSPTSQDSFFTPFNVAITEYSVPNKFTLMRNNTPHPLCALAAKQLQYYLHNQHDWEHNFGLIPNDTSPVIGKMFGVLVVQNKYGEVGYLAAFSGKLAGTNTHQKFVPPVFDALTHNSFLTKGMQVLAQHNITLAQLQAQLPVKNEEAIQRLKTERKKYSITLQQELFNNYNFLNRAGVSKNAHAIFKSAAYRNPPSGAGECATPKLLQYAFMHAMQPLAVAEFWWGLSPKSTHWQHGDFYACCSQKCQPILAHMLTNLAHEYI